MAQTQTSTHKRPMAGLLVAQFFGAFNDNAMKMILTLLGISLFTRDLAGQARSDMTQYVTSGAMVALTLPLALFSLPAGALADRLSKRSIIVSMKGLEVLLMVAAALLLLLVPAEQAFWPTLGLLAAMGLQSALFSPAKYGILPEVLPHEKLSRGNGLLEMLTFVAIIAGTAAGGAMLQYSGESAWLAILPLAVFALAGFAASLFVPKVPAARAPGQEGGLAAAWRTTRKTRVLWLTVLGLTLFWGVASLLGQDLVVYLKVVLRVSDDKAGIPLAVFAIGVGVGSVFAGRLSHGKVEYGLIPLGSIGLGLFTLVLGLAAPGIAGVYVLMALMGLSSGLIVVPLQSMLQWHAPAAQRGAVIALANIFVFTGALAGSLIGTGLAYFAGLSPVGIFLGAAAITLAGTAWAIKLLPDALVRLVAILMANTAYRIHVQGREHVPQTGGALLVANHLSLVDGLFVLASIDRPVRFIVDDGYFHHPLLLPFMKALGAIPVSSSGGPKVVMRALKDAGKYLDDGELVCIFAEGEISRTGMLLPFRRGAEVIVKGRDVPIIPMQLDGVWGSMFSPSGGRMGVKLPRQFPRPVGVHFGKPLVAGTPLNDVRQAVHDLSQQAWMQRKKGMLPLGYSVVRNLRKHPFQVGFADPVRGPLTKLKALTASIALARALRKVWADQQRVGILLPPSVGGALTNMAAVLSARTIVNLNYTTGKSGMESACRMAGLKTVITSRSFLQKAKLEALDGVAMVFLEDISPTINRRERWKALLFACVMPYFAIERLVHARRRPAMDDTAAIIFSSGSTGEPKGVQLSHFNILSNVEAAGQVLRFDHHDKLLHLLPLFHSFGNLLLWVGVHIGPGLVFAPNPLDAETIGHLCEGYGATAFCATPTFLQMYMKRIQPGQFGSMRLVVAGAEKLSPKFAAAFKDYFGVEVLEGYGCTECSPVIAVNSLDYRAPGFYQKGNRPGTVGQPFPGVSLKVVNPDTFEPLPVGEPGMLLVKGPNVMQGYLDRPDLTEKAMRDGWYITGDIARLSEDGFLTITDRLSRFSKIGGEMVPHGLIEEALHSGLEYTQQIFAVTAVSDERKGERIVVLHTRTTITVDVLIESLQRQGLPNLFIPKANDFIEVPALPVLGTGKIDLRGVKKLAQESLVAAGS
ncbi:MAG: MFS transporter [Planctomycetes bacterium]|nr:MFS transporter [Planctomycetota bacterium]